MLLSQKDFAAQLGQDKAHVTRLKQAGRLVMSGSLVDLEASLERIKATESPSHTHVAERHAATREAKQSHGTTGTHQKPNYSTRPYQESRALKEYYAAEKAKLDYEEQTKELIRTSELKFTLHEAAEIINNRLDGMGYTVATRVAGETDERKIKLIVDAYVDEIRAELNRQFNKLSQNHDSTTT